jgi:transcriptional regulator with XRE-family HTH domain
MKLNITKEWLERKLTEALDTNASAGRSDDQALDELKKDVERRTVSPTVFVEARTQLGMVIRFIREERGWSRQELADIATMDLEEIVALETSEAYEPTPRAVSYLADALGLSKDRLKELVGFVRKRPVLLGKREAANDREIRFAAKSKKLGELTDEQYEAVRALVEVLLDKKKV